MEQAQLFETADERGCTPMFGAGHRRASAVPYPRRYEVCSLFIARDPHTAQPFAAHGLLGVQALVLITLGDRDGVRPEHAVEMFRLIPNAQLAVFPGGDHYDRQGNNNGTE